ncbi:Alpha/Beta hydrolase protein [Absidia repens]|uniref:Carboxypeptidase n=1 Tax=Absidia repens TaxID=90262 RepID=A0A1X2I2F0_9FUNG|nr:Alpha/Beta hydrolase protein [Absidia repens]
MTSWIFYLASAICILITNQHLALGQKAEDFKVTSLPGVDVGKLPFDQYAGHIEVSPKTDGNLFFWMLDQVVPTQPKKLIIWLNGGPGCSSMDGLFLENGPYRVNPDLSLTINPNGWQDHATIVFLDQPVGTGFSFANGDGLMSSMTQIAEEFTTFLDKFMDVFPSLKEQDLYLAGESYAGTYIPYFADRMLKLNRKKENKYNLKGVAIGNGWISPRHQYEGYYDFSVQHDLLQGQYLEKATKNLNSCRAKLSVTSTISVDVCEDILKDITESNTHMAKEGLVCLNTYDVRLRNETYPDCGLTWPHELADVNKYLRTKELIKGIHSEKQALGWQECASSVSKALRNDESPPADLLLPGLLEELKVLLFSGEFDLICNHVGTEYMIGNMTWNGEKGFQDAERLDWTIGDKQAGYYIEERNLSYVLIKDGSHMVPYDKPLETLDMINRFMGVGNDTVHGVKSNVGGSGEKQEEDKPTITEHEQPVQENEDLESPMDTNNDEDHQTTTEEDKSNSEEINDDDAGTLPSDAPIDNEQATDEKDNADSGVIDRYTKRAGSYGILVVLVLFVAIGGCCYRYRTNNGSHNSSKKPWTSQWHQFKEMLGKRTSPQRNKFRLGDQDETNELDELVIDNPTLFAAEDQSDEDDSNNLHNQHRTAAASTGGQQKANASRFAIADEDSDDGFDDFADWDEEETLASVGKKDGKDH